MQHFHTLDEKQTTGTMQMAIASPRWLNKTQITLSKSTANDKISRKSTIDVVRVLFVHTIFS